MTARQAAAATMRTALVHQARALKLGGIPAIQALRAYASDVRALANLIGLPVHDVAADIAAVVMLAPRAQLRLVA